MGEDLRAMSPTEDWERRYRVEVERSRILEGEKRELLDNLAESAVQVKEINVELGKVSERRRIARNALVETHEQLRAAHVKRFPKHWGSEGDVVGVDCKTCRYLRGLYRQIERSAD